MDCSDVRLGAVCAVAGPVALSALVSDLDGSRHEADCDNGCRCPRSKDSR